MGELTTAPPDEPLTARLEAPAGGASIVNRLSGREIAALQRPLLEELGAMLQAAREAAGLTLEELGPSVGSPSSLRQIERGQVRTRASRLRPWLERLGVDPDPVLERFAAAIAPERSDGRQTWKPWTPPATVPRETAPPELPDLPEYAQRALGAELWGMRDQAGRSRPELARALGVSRILVWMVEHGLRRPSVELLNAWLDEVGTDVDRLGFAVRFPGVIASVSRRHPSGGAPKSVPPRTHGR